MDLLSQLSDDQVALIGCVVALVGCGGLVSVSHYLGGHGRQKRGVSQLSSGTRESHLRIAPMPVNSERSDRKAA